MAEIIAGGRPGQRAAVSTILRRQPSSGLWPLLATRPLISAEVVIGIAAAFFIVGGLSQLIAWCAIVQPGWGWQTEDRIIALRVAAYLRPRARGSQELRSLKSEAARSPAEAPPSLSLAVARGAVEAGAERVVVVL